MQIYKSLLLFFVISLTTFPSFATKISVISALSCNTGNVLLTSIRNSNELGTELISNIYSATGCAAFSGNDDGNLKPSANFGAFGDGLLNGNNNFFQEGAFVETKDLLDLDGVGGVNDPGWIRLGTLNDLLDVSYENVTAPFSNAELNIEDVLTIDFSCTDGKTSECLAGTWSLKTDLSIIEEVQSVLGRSTFDRLAISLKVGNRFSVYDFDFKDIFSKEPPGRFDFFTPYTLSGTFSTADFLNKNGKAQSISHVSVWARDPLAVDVAEPNILTLFILMSAFYLRKKIKVVFDFIRLEP